VFSLRTGLATALGAILFPAAPMGAQRIVGQVIDLATSRPIVGVTVQLVELAARPTGVNRTVRSDSVGKFVLPTPVAGVYQIRYTRFGYQPRTSSPILVPNTGDVGVTAAIAPEQGLLDAAQSRATSAMSEEYFETRRISGLGRILTREQLDSLRHGDVVSVIRATPGVSIAWDPDAKKWSVAFTQRAETDKACAPAYFLNGSRLTGLAGQYADSAAALLFSTPIQTVHAVEIYGALSAIPGVYQGSDMSCGTVAVWTRRPG
jgi:hypothetical protein